MDVVLELTDTFIADYAYAFAHPAQPVAPHDLPDLSSNSTAQAYSSSWKFESANPFFVVEPSKYAYMSAWDRDNLYRQCITLFLITWFVTTLIQDTICL